MLFYPSILTKSFNPDSEISLIPVQKFSPKGKPFGNPNNQIIQMLK